MAVLAFVLAQAACGAGPALPRRGRGAARDRRHAAQGPESRALAERPADERGAAAPPGEGRGARSARDRGHRRLFLGQGRDAHRRERARVEGHASSVEPGERTRVSDVDIRFSGPATQDAEAQRLFKRGARRLAPAARPAVPPGRLGRRQARRGARAVELALRRGARRRQPRARSTPRRARRGSKSSWRAARRSASGRCASPASSATRTAVAENLSPIRPGDHLRPRPGDRLPAPACWRAATSPACRPTIDTHPLLADAAPLRVAVIEAASQDIETGVSYTTDAGPRARAALQQPGHLRLGLALQERPAPRPEHPADLQARLRFAAAPGARWNSLFARARQQRHPERDHARARRRHRAQPVRAPRAGRAHRLGALRGAERRRPTSPTTATRSTSATATASATPTTWCCRARASSARAELGGAPDGLSTAALPARHGRAARCSSASAATATSCCAARRAWWWRRRARASRRTFLFRTGGDQTVRGYAFESLGVRQGDAIVGGRRLLVGSRRIHALDRRELGPGGVRRRRQRLGRAARASIPR